MFQRLHTGFALARSSWHVLRTDKHLLVFPVLSGLSSLLVLASFATPFLLRPEWAGFRGRWFHNGGAFAVEPSPWFWLVVFAFYFCNFFVIVFFNAALLSCALLRFNGGAPSVGDGLRAAGARLPQILAWALVSATAGTLLKFLEGLNQKVGGFVSALLGTAWSIMTFFVVPVLVVEKVGPLKAVGRSLALLRQTWGEALVGKVGIGFVLFLLALPWLGLLIGGAYAAGLGWTAGWVLLGVAAAYFLVWLAVGPALNGIHLAALYQYALHGEAPSGFDRATLATAFRGTRNKSLPAG